MAGRAEYRTGKLWSVTASSRGQIFSIFLKRLSNNPSLHGRLFGKQKRKSAKHRLIFDLYVLRYIGSDGAGALAARPQLIWG
jgi:hypothetical protein